MECESRIHLRVVRIVDQEGAGQARAVLARGRARALERLLARLSESESDQNREQT